MSFSSVDDLVSEISSDKFLRTDWYYKLIANSGSTSSLSVGLNLSSAGIGAYGSRNLFPGTAKTWQTCDDATGNGTQIFGIPHGGNVSPDTKHLISVSAINPPTGLPVQGGVLQLVDIQGYWPGIQHNNTSAQTLSGTPTLRYANGEGCRLYTVATSALGSTAHNIRIGYYNQANNLANTGNIAVRTSSPVGQITSAFPGGAPSLYFPLVNGDTGVQGVANVVMSATAQAANSALVLAKPLVTVTFQSGVNQVSEREFVYQTPSMPRIMDGACLAWLYYSGTGGTSSIVTEFTNFSGEIQVAWG